ncbi:MAG: phosphotransferase, partial [Thermomicrobiales bacterium]
LNPVQVGNVSGQLAAFLHSLHTIPVTPFAQAGVPVEDATFWEGWLATVRDRLYPLVERDAAERFDRYAARFLEGYRGLAFGLKHGDFGGGNILAGDGKITGIIDFGSVSIGDVASDIAGLAASYDDAFLDLIAETYPEVHAMKPRVAFYCLAFAAMEALHGMEYGDTDALQAGLASLDHSR